MAGVNKKAVERFLENPFWKKYYEDAPSEACKKYIELEFTNSMSVADGKGMLDIKEESQKCEDAFGIEDWKHLAKYAGNNPFRGKCLKKIRELS